jgi:hypothetical protein
MAALSESAFQIVSHVFDLQGHDYSLEKFSKAETSNFKILPMRSTSVTMPVAMKLAQTLTA